MVTGDFYDQIEGWIVSGAVDCGFLRLPPVKRLQTYALHRDELQVIVPCDHPYADRDPFPMSALAEEPFIQLEEGDDYEKALSNSTRLFVDYVRTWVAENGER